MAKYWVPVSQPPHPNEISGISPFAEGIIQNLRHEAMKNEEKLKLLRPQIRSNNDYWFQNTYNQSQHIQLNFNGIQISSQNTWYASQYPQTNISQSVSHFFNQQQTLNRSQVNLDDIFPIRENRGRNENRFYDTIAGSKNDPTVNAVEATAINYEDRNCSTFHKDTIKQRGHSNFNANGSSVFGASQSPGYGTFHEINFAREGQKSNTDCPSKDGTDYTAAEMLVSKNMQYTSDAAGFNKAPYVPKTKLNCKNEEEGNRKLNTRTIVTPYGRDECFSNGLGEINTNTRDFTILSQEIVRQNISAFHETPLTQINDKNEISMTSKEMNNNPSNFSISQAKATSKFHKPKTSLAFTPNIPNEKPIMMQSRVSDVFPVKKNYNNCPQSTSIESNKAPNCVDKTVSKLSISIDKDSNECRAKLPSNKVIGISSSCDAKIESSNEIANPKDKPDIQARIEQFTSKVKSKLEMFKAVKIVTEPGQNTDIVDFMVHETEVDEDISGNKEVSTKKGEHNNEVLLFSDDGAAFFDSEMDSQLMKIVGTAEETIEKEPNSPVGNNVKETKKAVGSPEVIIKKPSCFVENNVKETNMQSKTIDEKIKRKFSVFEEKAGNQIIPASQTSSNKKIKFQAPLKKKLVQTKLFDNKKLSEIIDLNKCSLRDLESQLNYCKPMEICFTIQFSNGSTQLSNPESSGSYKSILLRIMWQEDNVEICSIRSDLWKTEKSCVKDFFRTILSTKSSLVCLESAELLLFLIQKFQFERDLTLNWQMFDPLIAYWLLEPEEPCTTFAALVDELGLNNAKKTKEYRSNNCKHLDLLSESFNQLRERLKKEELWNIFSEMEVKLTPILARMTQRGLLLSEAHLREIGAMISKRLTTLEAEAQKLVGCPFLLTSAVQLRRVLFDNLKLDQQINVQVKGTATLGVKSTSEAVLKQLAHVHPLPNIILEHRRLHKLKSTFVDGILTFVKKGAVHTIWEQRSAATGRLASSNPNLQSIPKQWFTIFDATNKNLEFNIRSAFLPRKGYKFLLADFQQIEFRIFAHLTQDPALVDIFLKSDDVFLTLAERWLGSDDKPVSSEDREKTKRIVYAVMYGAGPSKLAEFLNISHQEAAAIYNKFCASFPIMKKFPKQVAEQCVADGKLTTVMGRVRKFANITDTNSTLKAQAERQALNFLIQGAAADICKQAMLQCESVIVNGNPALDAHLLLQIHDELIWEVSENHIDHFKDMVKETMENCRVLDGTLLNLSVPIRVKIEEQLNWAPEKTAPS